MKTHSIVAFLFTFFLSITKWSEGAFLNRAAHRKQVLKKLSSRFVYPQCAFTFKNNTVILYHYFISFFTHFCCTKFYVILRKHTCNSCMLSDQMQFIRLELSKEASTMLGKFKKVKFITVCSRIGLTVLLYKIINFFYRCSEKRIFFG